MSERFALLVVGGGPAGFSAADAYREASGDGAVAIVTDEGRMPYRRPPLTKHLLRGDGQESDLPLAPESWLAKRAVSLVTGRAVALDRHARKVMLSGGRTLAYRTCVLATGAEPRLVPIPGADDPAVRAVRTLSDLHALLARLTPRAAVAVVGSGFIGCEIAASLTMRGHPVTLVSDEPAPNAARLGIRVGREIERWLREAGVDVRLAGEVQCIERFGEQLEVSAGGRRARAAVVVMATGVSPRGELAAAAGIPLADGAVPVNASMQTEDASLLAAGDVCRAHNTAAGRPLRVEHWGDALAQGAVAGRVAAGEPATWSSVPGFWSTIGPRTLKYGAWGDGFDDVRLVRDHGDAFTAWYGRQGRLVGVLAHGADRDYERGLELIAGGAAWDR